MDTHSAFAGHDGTDAGTRAASIKTGLGDECIEWFDVVVGQTLNFKSQTGREGNFPIAEFLSSFLFPVEHTNRSFSMPRELLMDQMRTAGLGERLRLSLQPRNMRLLPLWQKQWVALAIRMKRLHLLDRDDLKDPYALVRIDCDEE